jgi:hypothetical protein
MTANVGLIDRILRLLVGVGLLAFFFLGEGGVRWLGLIGLVLLATAVFGWCPAYRLLGLSTCPARRS